MKKVYVLLAVMCFLIGTAYAEQAVQDDDPLNIVGGGYTVQYFDNRNISPADMPDWAVTSKGEYFMLSAEIQIGWSLADFDDIIEVRAKHSGEPELEVTLIRSKCNTILGQPYKEFTTHLRYIPWMRNGAWTYTLRYHGNDGQVHVQSYTRTGDNQTAATPAIPPVWFEPSTSNPTQMLIKWVGIGPPGPTVQYTLRLFDEEGCISPYGMTWMGWGEHNGVWVIFTSVNGLEGKVVRVENRIVLPGYGTIARSCYLVRVPY